MSAATRTYEDLERGWQRAAEGVPTGVIAHDLGMTPQQLRVAMNKEGLAISAARTVWHETLVERLKEEATRGEDPAAVAARLDLSMAEVRAAMKDAGLIPEKPAPAKPRRKYKRVPQEALEEAVQEVLDGGPGVSVSRIAEHYDLLPVTLNAAVRAHLAKHGIGLSAAVVRHHHKAESMRAVEEYMAKHEVGMAEACRALDLNYQTVYKGFQRQRIVLELQGIKDVMLARGADEDGLREKGKAFVAGNAPQEPEKLTEWLGKDYVSGCKQQGVDPVGTSVRFARWLTGRY